MLMRLYFTEFLLAFCAVHLVCAARDHLAAKFAAYLEKRMPASAVTNEMLMRAARESDWYVYFHRSDLVGEDCRQKDPRSPGKRDGAMRPRPITPKRARDGRATAHPDMRFAC